MYKNLSIYSVVVNVQEPSTKKLGDMDCNDSFQYVPLLPGLCSFLSNDAVFDEVSF